MPAAAMEYDPHSNSEQALCRLDDIPDGGARGFLRERNDDRVFVVRRAGRVFAYLNSCPHNWRPLEYRQDQFLSPQGDRIICYAHGAHFRIEDGLCFFGPCAGQRLIAIPLRIENDSVIIPKALPTAAADAFRSRDTLSTDSHARLQRERLKSKKANMSRFAKFW